MTATGPCIDSWYTPHIPTKTSKGVCDSLSSAGAATFPLDRIEESHNDDDDHAIILVSSFLGLASAY